MIDKLIVENYKIFKHFELKLNENLNIIVGNNEAGKSTILEAINLALTSRLNGRHISSEMSPFLFCKEIVQTYLDDLKAGKKPALPELFVELYFNNSAELPKLIGTNNSLSENCAGVRLEIVFDKEFTDEYEQFAQDPEKVTTIPAEYYKVSWYSFAGNAITARGLTIGSSFIDATTIRLQNGADFYLQSIINSGLENKDKVDLSMVYRGLRENFISHPSIQLINTKLVEKHGKITDKLLEVSVDISQKANWETNLIPYLDSLPFTFIGKGEQNAIKILLALDNKIEDSQIVLIEEPENHLSFTTMSKLIRKIQEKCEGKQLIITTHSAYVANKLGLDSLILLNKNTETRLNKLPEDTQKYFMKLSGYDTLRMVLAKKSILVEGPSDELIVQRAYSDKHGTIPIENEIDIINVRGLSFARFLDIAVLLASQVSVITDNDSDYDSKITKKYAPYIKHDNIKVYASTDTTKPTLEPQIVAANSVELLNEILGTTAENETELIEYMANNKADCALKIFESGKSIKMPTYIEDAIN